MIRPEAVLTRPPSRKRTETQSQARSFPETFTVFVEESSDFRSMPAASTAWLTASAAPWRPAATTDPSTVGASPGPSDKAGVTSAEAHAHGAP